MDRLSDLPEKNDTVKTPEEAAIMGQFFPENGGPSSRRVGQAEPDEDDEDERSEPSRLDWKLIGTSSVLFLALANPWIDSALCKIPYCGSAGMLLVIKFIVFLLLMIVISLFT